MCRGESRPKATYTERVLRIGASVGANSGERVTLDPSRGEVALSFYCHESSDPCNMTGRKQCRCPTIYSPVPFAIDISRLSDLCNLRKS